MLNSLYLPLFVLNISIEFEELYKIIKVIIKDNLFIPIS